jgi:hypothetical protein
VKALAHEMMYAELEFPPRKTHQTPDKELESDPKSKIVVYSHDLVTSPSVFSIREWEHSGLPTRTRVQREIVLEQLRTQFETALGPILAVRDSAVRPDLSANNDSNGDRQASQSL